MVEEAKKMNQQSGFEESPFESIFNTPYKAIMGFKPTKILFFIWFAVTVGTLSCLSLVIRILFSSGRCVEKKHHSKPNILDDEKYGKHNHIKLSTGMKLHYVEDGSTDKQLMLFLHGFPELWFSWRHQMEAFRNDYHVVAVDQRGYGDSDKPSSVNAYESVHIANDAIAMIEELRGDQRVVLAAHDWGGIIAWIVALKRPDLVEKLIIMNAPHVTQFSKFMLSHVGQLLKSYYVFLFQYPCLPETLISLNDFESISKFFASAKMSDEEIEPFRWNASLNLTTMINWYRASWRSGANDLKKELESKKVACPTLVLWGDADVALDRRMVNDMFAVVDGLKVVMVDGCSHWVQQEAAHFVNSEMKKFLGGSS